MSERDANFDREIIKLSREITRKLTPSQMYRVQLDEQFRVLTAKLEEREVYDVEPSRRLDEVLDRVKVAHYLLFGDLNVPPISHDDRVVLDRYEMTKRVMDEACGKEES